MENLLSTSLKNIKKFVDIICEFYEQYDDEKNQFFYNWYHKKSWDDFLNIIKKEKLNYVSKDDDKWVIEIQNKFNNRINNSLLINWKDQKIDSFLEKIYKDIILESELILKNLGAKRPNFKNELKNIPFCKKICLLYIIFMKIKIFRVKK